MPEAERRVELERELGLLDVTACDLEHGLFRVAGAGEDENGVASAGEALRGAAGVEPVVGAGFAGVMDEQHGDAVFERESLQRRRREVIALVPVGSRVDAAAHAGEYGDEG